MAKQTFTTGQVLTAAQMTSLQQTAMLGGAANAKTASYVLVAADAGDAITMNNAGATTITVNTGLFAAGDTVTIINLGAGACTITAGTATVATSGSLVLAQNQGGVLRFTSASAAIFFQFATPAAASGGMTLLNGPSGTTFSGSTLTINVTTTGYTALKIYCKGVYQSANDVFNLRINGDSGSNYSYATLRSGPSGVASASSTSYFYINQGSVTSNSDAKLLTFAEIDIFNPTDTDFVQINHTASNGPSGDMRFTVGQGMYDCSAAISSVSFVCVSGTFSGGTAYVYGVK